MSTWEEGEEGIATPIVTAEDIGEVVAMWTGIPTAARIASEESARLMKMEEALKSRVIGQRRGDRVHRQGGPPSPCRAERSAPPDRRVPLPRPDRRWQDPPRPSQLAEFMFDSQDNMIKLDMSEFGEKHTVSRLVGAPGRLRRVRGRWPAHGYRSPQVVLSDPVGRD